MIKIALYADIKPTEDPDKVKQAIQNLFPDAQIDIQNTKLEAHSNTLDRFRELLKRQRIRDSARSQLLNGCGENTIIFKLNKQLAYMNKINFAVVNHPLGEITAHITCDNPHELIDHLTNKK
jgi:predicted RNA binding protein with dsRBD fold (UPF0201 family)